MKSKQLILFSLFITLISLYSCNNNKSVVNESNIKIEASKYFNTNDIDIKSDNKKIVINIANSQTVNQFKQQMSTNWINAESIVSAGVFQMRNVLVNKYDSIEIIVSVNNNLEKYDYTSNQIRYIEQFWKTTTNFLKLLSKSKFNDSKLLIDDTILKSTSDSKLYDFLYKSFSMNEKQEKITFKAFKIVNYNYSVFTDVCYSKSGCQTYGFVFLNNINKIAGINIY